MEGREVRRGRGDFKRKRRGEARATMFDSRRSAWKGLLRLQIGGDVEFPAMEIGVSACSGGN